MKSDKLPSISLHKNDDYFLIDSDGFSIFEVDDIRWIHLNHIVSGEVELMHNQYGLVDETIAKELPHYKSTKLNIMRSSVV